MEDQGISSLKLQEIISQAQMKMPLEKLQQIFQLRMRTVYEELLYCNRIEIIEIEDQTHYLENPLMDLVEESNVFTLDKSKPEESLVLHKKERQYVNQRKSQIAQLHAIRE